MSCKWQNAQEYDYQWSSYIKCNVKIAVYWLKSQTTSHGDFVYVFLGCYLPIQPPLKLLPSVCDVRSFSPCTNLSHELQDLQHFMFEQIDLHVFNLYSAITLQLLLCVDIIFNKYLNKCN